MEYFLSDKQVLILAKLNIDSAEYRREFIFNYDTYNGEIQAWGPDKDRYMDKMKAVWNNRLFKTIIEKQPELNKLLDIFWISASKEKYIEIVFGEVFKNKLNINLYPELIFNNVSYYNNGQESKSYIKEIIKNSPILMNTLHQQLLEFNGDSKKEVLTSCYIDLLPKYINEIKDNKKNILNILAICKMW